MLLKPFKSQENTVLLTQRLIKLLKVKITPNYIEDKILSHPNHYSLLAISDTLKSFNTETLAVKLDSERLRNAPGPFIAQISVEELEYFVVVKNVVNNEVNFYDQYDKYTSTPFEEFISLWSGICLFAEVSGDSIETEFQKMNFANKLKNFLIIILLVSVFGWFYNSLRIKDITLSAIPLIFYFLSKVIGLLIGIILLWYEIDQHNPVLQKICSGNRNVNCNAVLGSKQASFLYNSFNWSEVGFAYFFGTFSFMLINNFSTSSLAISGWLSVFSVPIIIASLIYQGIVLKQWCRLCIYTQSILAVEVITSISIYWYRNPIDISLFVPLISLLILPLITWKILKPILEQSKESKYFKRNFLKIKNNPNVFLGLLQKNRKIKHSTQGLGIIMKNDNPKYFIIKVCSPYCGPCAKAHPVLGKLFDQGIIDLQILFTATSNEKDYASKPVKHFLAIDSKEDSKKTHQALDDWYNTDKKNYDQFALKYPMNSELKEQDDKLLAMSNWCKDEKIKHTPTIFINGYELSEEYDLEDLKDILK